MSLGSWLEGGQGCPGMRRDGRERPPGSACGARRSVSPAPARGVRSRLSLTGHLRRHKPPAVPWPAPRLLPREPCGGAPVFPASLGVRRPLGSRPSGRRRGGAGAFLRVCTGPGTAGLRAWWPGRREQVDQTCADTEPPQRLQVRLASARSRVLPPTLASPGGRCAEDRGMAIVRTAGTRVCPTLARRQALCLSRPRMPSCLMPPDRFAEGICRPHLQMRKRRLGAAKHVAQNHLGAAFGLEVRGR